MERIFRSTGTGLAAHRRFLALAGAAKLPVRISEMTRAQCRMALQLIEYAAHREGLGLFRDVRTQWEAL
jgi:hypothetical protein